METQDDHMSETVKKREKRNDDSQRTELSTPVEIKMG